MGVSRRNWLKGAGQAMVASTVGGLAVAAGRDSVHADNATPPELPWSYRPLDPAVVGERGYNGYYKGACCFGAFDAIVGELQRELGPPYTAVPTSMMIYGEGGVAGNSTLCGALNGVAAAIFLTTGGFAKDRRDTSFGLIRELFSWYEQEPLPTFRPAKPKFEIKPSVAHSPLCHVSVTTWCKATGLKAFSPERSERCGWLTGAVAKHAVELLNAHAEGKFKAVHDLPAAVATCRSCHDQGSTLENTRGRMECSGCHFTGAHEHPKI
jgi:putative redox-active protein with C_GCAxxG_C_C motif